QHEEALRAVGGGVVAVKTRAAEEIARWRALPVGGCHHDLGGRIALAQAAGERSAVGGAQALLDDQHCCRLGIEEPEAGPRALGSEDPVAFGLERRVQGGAVLRTLTHQEECGAARTGLPSAVHVPRAAPRHTAATGALHVPRRARAHGRPRLSRADALRTGVEAWHTCQRGHIVPPVWLVRGDFAGVLVAMGALAAAVLRRGLALTGR